MYSHVNVLLSNLFICCLEMGLKNKSSVVEYRWKTFAQISLEVNAAINRNFPCHQEITKTLVIKKSVYYKSPCVNSSHSKIRTHHYQSPDQSGSRNLLLFIINANVQTRRNAVKVPVWTFKYIWEKHTYTLCVCTCVCILAALLYIKEHSEQRWGIYGTIIEL